MDFPFTDVKHGTTYYPGTEGHAARLKKANEASILMSSKSRQFENQIDATTVQSLTKSIISLLNSRLTKETIADELLAKSDMSAVKGTPLRPGTERHAAVVHAGIQAGILMSLTSKSTSDINQLSFKTVQSFTDSIIILLKTPNVTKADIANALIKNLHIDAKVNTEANLIRAREALSV